ncbi:hypothetical protein Y032_0073g736 [Ancylostoma ceylanicum]|uniref:Uncharacterized protein n=1 Tax=Ancylostoma ceylanicum TaxID=53326 RepID=A0A016TWV1_9BILA|nr:hypothetical protein Y032_0073g736 [Ancylostoma ceylanicum]
MYGRLRVMRKTLKWGLIGAAVAAVIAAIIAVVLVLVLKKNGDDPGTSERVMYFAIHLGDNKALHRSKYEQYRNQQCSIDVNVDNTRKSITAMKDVTQKYSFILFSDTIETTAPMSNEEAIAKLDSIKSKTQGPLFSQESVVKEFERRSGKQNRLVYYIPCSFDYSHHDEDVRKFVEAVRKAGLEKRIMVVSNTRPAKQVSDLYQLDNVAGSDTTDIVQKIMEFGHQGSEETTLEPAQTSMKPKTSTIRKTTKTTTRRSSNPTRSTDHTLTPKPRTFNCIFVGDNFNYGSDQDAYEMEADLITGVAHDLFASFRGSSIGLWAYGHTRYSKDADSALKRMRNRYNEFVIDLKLMKYHYIEDPLSTAAAIEKLNQLNSPKDVVDCLVFFSAQQDVESLPMLHPLHLPVDTVVAVGLNNTDLYDRVHPSSGIAVSVPIKYADSDVQSIIDAITKRIKPTRRPTTAKPTGVTVTTKKPTTTKTLTTTALHRTTTKRHLTTKKPTTTAKPKGFNCLFVGDNFNFGDNQDDYETEADLIANVAHDLWVAFRGSSIGLWAYGHTRLSKDADSALKRMRKRYNEFIIELKLMKYHYIDDPLSTADAIKKLNRLNSSKDVVDCLVFFSAQQDVESLPVLNPVHLPVDTVVAVGLNNTDLSDRVHPSTGVAISVPIDYEDSDVKSIVDAITKRTKPTKRPTTTKPTASASSTVTTKRPATTKTPATTGNDYNMRAYPMMEIR